MPFKRTRDENEPADSEVEEQGRRLPREDERERMPRLTGRRNEEDSEVEEQMPRLRGGHDEDGEADAEVDEQGRRFPRVGRDGAEESSEVDEQRWTHR